MSGSRWLRRLLLLGGFVVACATVWTVARTRGPATVEAAREDLVLAVEVTGALKSVRSEVLGPPQIPDVWDFKISMLVPEGATVKQGQPVLGFDTSDLERKLQEAQATAGQAAKEIEKRETDLKIRRRDDALKLAESEAKLRRARLKLDAPEELSSAKDLVQTRLDRDLAESEIGFLSTRVSASDRAAAAEILGLKDKRGEAEARVAELQRSIAAMTLRAGRDGVVIYRESWRGEKKKVGDNCWRQERVLEIPDPSELVADAEIDESDSGRVASGQGVTLKLDANPDLEYRGKVERVESMVERPNQESPLKVVRARVTLAELDPARMRPGMRFRGSIEVERIRDVLVLPAESLRSTPSGPVVFRRGWLGLERIPVVVGNRSAERVEIREGLQAGERVAREAPLSEEGT